MGRDKRSIVLGGKTLLERASEALASVCPQVIVSGTPAGSVTGFTSVPDQVAGCGPLGGIVAALGFARELAVEWTMFLPVDMPLLPAELLAALLAVWRGAAARGAWVCCAESDGVVQPLVSLVHHGAVLELRQRLQAGDLRVRPGLESAAGELARERGTDPERAFYKAVVRAERPVLAELDHWKPSEAEWSRRGLWFSNVNTPEELARVKRALSAGAVRAAVPPSGMGE